LVGSVITAGNDPLLIDVAFGSLSPGDRLEAMTALGHFDQFPATTPSVGYLFSQETVAGATPDPDAPRKNRRLG